MSERVRTVLFLCSANAARSLMAEVALNWIGKGRFQAFSAGSHPAGDVHPLTLEALRGVNLPIEGLRSKSWDEFARPGAPSLDYVITVCDKAAGEFCPVWPGQPMTAHWGFADPVEAHGTDSERLRVFRRVLNEIQTRVRLFSALPLASLDRLGQQHELDRIGTVTSPDAESA